MAQKYYAVRTGKKPGIYNTWEECKAVVDGYPGAQYKSFKTREEAEAFAGVSGAAGIEKKEKAAVFSEFDSYVISRAAIQKTQNGQGIYRICEHAG